MSLKKFGKNFGNSAKAIKPFDRFPDAAPKPLFWKFYTKHQRFTYTMKGYAASFATTMTPSIHILISHLTKPTRFDLTNFNELDLDSSDCTTETILYLPTKTLQYLAKLNNLKCEAINNKEDWKQNEKYAKKILCLSGKIAKHLYIFIWNVYYWKVLEKSLTESNEYNYHHPELGGVVHYWGVENKLIEKLTSPYNDSAYYDWKH